MCKLLKQLKYALALAVRKIMHSACCLDANKAFSFTLCLIGILTTRLMLYFTYTTRCHALTNTYIHTYIYTYVTGPGKKRSYLHKIHLFVLWHVYPVLRVLFKIC